MKFSLFISIFVLAFTACDTPVEQTTELTTSIPSSTTQISCESDEDCGEGNLCRFSNNGGQVCFFRSDGPSEPVSNQNDPECILDEDCGVGNLCGLSTTGEPVCVTADSFSSNSQKDGAECTSDVDCASLGSIYKCFGDTLVDFPPVCTDGQCGHTFKWTSAAFCNEGTCNEEKGYCSPWATEDPECSSDADCDNWGQTRQCLDNVIIEHDAICLAGTCQWSLTSAELCKNGCNLELGGCISKPTSNLEITCQGFCKLTVTDKDGTPITSSDETYADFQFNGTHTIPINYLDEIQVQVISWETTGDLTLDLLSDSLTLAQPNKQWAPTIPFELVSQSFTITELGTYTFKVIHKD